MQNQAGLVYVMAVYIPDVQPLHWCHFQRPPGTPSPAMTRTNASTWRRNNLRCCFSSLQPVTHTESHTVLQGFQESLLVYKIGRVSSFLPLSDIIWLCLPLGFNLFCSITALLLKNERSVIASCQLQRTRLLLLFSNVSKCKSPTVLSSWQILV